MNEDPAPPDEDRPTPDSQMSEQFAVYARLEPITLAQILQVSGFVVIGLSALKLLRIAHGDPQLAAAILNSAGYTAPIAFVLMAMAPLLAPVLMFAITRQWYAMKALTSLLASPVQYQRWYWPAVVLLLLLTIVFTPWYITVIAALLLGFYLLLSVFVQRRHYTFDPDHVSRLVQRLRLMARFDPSILTFAALSSLFPITADTAWTAHEVVDTGDAATYQ